MSQRAKELESYEARRLDYLPRVCLERGPVLGEFIEQRTGLSALKVDPVQVGFDRAHPVRHMRLLAELKPRLYGVAGRSCGTLE